MAVNVKDLCRLCASKEEFCKDILDESNKNILTMIKDFLQIVVYENDNLPTKVCLNCEEKMVTFQLFVLECYKTQETLRNMYTALNLYSDCNVKTENMPSEIPSIKSEVKVETITGDIKCELSHEASLTGLLPYNDNDNFQEDNDDDNDDVDYLDDITIASLKKLTKLSNFTKKDTIDKNSEEFKQILKRPGLKVKDFVKLECCFCETKIKTWNAFQYHYVKVHRCPPLVFCLCGFEIRCKSVLYKHISDHKLESKKLKKQLGYQEDQDDSKYDRLNVRDFVNFACTSCKKKCSSWYSLKSHCEKVHKTVPVVNCACGITLKSKSVMYKHIQDHKNPNVFPCDKCPRITKSLSALSKHKMRHVPKADRKYGCGSCDKIFTSKDAMKSHEKSHIPIDERKIYHCDACTMKFTTRSSLASHKRVVHDKIKGYVCDLCGYACGTNGELRQHRAIHSDDKPYICGKCNKPFKTYSNLKTHMDIHEETSYECFICQKVLNSRRTLRKHLLVHEDKCRYVCSYCNKAFKRKQTLKVHTYTHTGDKPLTCKWCTERFAYASTLRSHRLRCHPDKMAGQGHDTYGNYNSHVVQDNYTKDESVRANVVVAVTKNEVEAM